MPSYLSPDLSLLEHCPSPVNAAVDIGRLRRGGLNHPGLSDWDGSSPCPTPPATRDERARRSAASFAYRFNGRTLANPSTGTHSTTAPEGCDEPSSIRCQTTQLPSCLRCELLLKLVTDKPGVIPRVGGGTSRHPIRDGISHMIPVADHWSTFIFLLHRRCRSQAPFYAFALFEWFPTILRTGMIERHLDTFSGDRLVNSRLALSPSAQVLGRWLSQRYKKPRWCPNPTSTTRNWLTFGQPCTTYPVPMHRKKVIMNQLSQKAQDLVKFFRRLARIKPYVSLFVTNFTNSLSRQLILARTFRWVGTPDKGGTNFNTLPWDRYSYGGPPFTRA